MVLAARFPVIQSAETGGRASGENHPSEGSGGLAVNTDLHLIDALHVSLMMPGIFPAHNVRIAQLTRDIARCMNRVGIYYVFEMFKSKVI